MELFGITLNTRMVIWFGLHGLIIVDIILITIAMIFTLPSNIARGIQSFDFVVCILLLSEWTINFYLSKPKKVFLKQKDNIISLIASIPFDVILPAVIPGVNLLRYLRLLKLLRIMVLFNKLFNGISNFIKKTNMDKIIGGIVFTILLFTILIYVFGNNYNLFDSFYFVVVTLTTVGYGDITPNTFNEKLITIILIFIGILVFSTITGAISSFLTDRILDDEEEDIINNFKIIFDELDKTHGENQMLKENIHDLKKDMDILKEMLKEK